MKDFKQTTLNLPKVKDFIKKSMEVDGLTRKQAKWQYDRLKEDEIWVNDIYQVNIARGDNVPNNMMGVPMVHLSIKRLDKKPITDWRHKQAIKDSLVGPNHEGFELYPSATRLVDTANQYHLFVFDDPDLRLPIGWAVRAVKDDHHPDSGVTQRPLDQEEVDEDHAQAMMSQELSEALAGGKPDIDAIMAVAAMMDNADVPQEGRTVQLVDPATGEYVSSEDNPERIREIIQMFIDEDAAGNGAPPRNEEGVKLV